MLHAVATATKPHDHRAGRAPAAETTQWGASNQALLRAPRIGAPPRPSLLQRQCSACSERKETDAPVLRPKLEIGAVDDPSEREADSVADAVMNGGLAAPSIPQPVQRRVARETDGLDEKKEGAADVPVQKKSVSAEGSSATTPGFEQALSARIGTAGERLSPRLGTFMGERFGRSFEDVRIHRDAEAGSLARGVSAKAFTVGRDVFFAPGAWRPGDRDGQHLIAHELTHVVQQDAAAGNVARKIQRVQAPTCASYGTVDAAEPLSGYNCAGLALRTYSDIAPSATVDTTLVGLHPNGRSANCAESCGANTVKYWKWDYDLQFEHADGTVARAAQPDFHIVGGLSDAAGNDPVNVSTKNGHRGVHGPGPGGSFRPAAREQTLKNDATEAPIPDRFSHRLNMVESCMCSDC